MLLVLSDKYHQVIVFTAVSPNNKNKNKINLLKQAHLVIYFPLEDEYTLLVRVVGPFAPIMLLIHLLITILALNFC